MPGPAVNLVRRATKVVRDRAGGARLRAAGRACSGAGIDLALPAAPRAQRPDAPRGWRKRRLGAWRRVRPRDAVQLGVEQAPDPRVEHQAVHDGGPARPLRPLGNPQDEAVRPPRKRGRGSYPAREPDRGRRRGSGARARGLHARQRTSAHSARPLASDVPQCGNQARHRKDPRRRLDGEAVPAVGLSFNSGIAHGHYARRPELVAGGALRRKLRAKGGPSREVPVRRPAPGGTRQAAAWKRRLKPDPQAPCRRR